jgi:hypothetical protein
LRYSSASNVQLSASIRTLRRPCDLKCEAGRLTQRPGY